MLPPRKKEKTFQLFQPYRENSEEELEMLNTQAIARSTLTRCTPAGLIYSLAGFFF